MRTSALLALILVLTFAPPAVGQDWVEISIVRTASAWTFQVSRVVQQTSWASNMATLPARIQREPRARALFHHCCRLPRRRGSGRRAGQRMPGRRGTVPRRSGGERDRARLLEAGCPRRGDVRRSSSFSATPSSRI